MEVSQGEISVLGLYGLPGSGKSTLSKCLHDLYRSIYGGFKTLYVEFPSNPSRADVVDKLKKLLQLTDFRNRVSLDDASNLEQVEDLLKRYGFPRCKVFLVLDNISERSWQAVDRILHMGVGEGSIIILVARTLDVLRPTLHSLKTDLHWACESIDAPIITAMEATEILLNVVNPGCTSRQEEIAKEIVRMCSFDRPKHGDELLLLPLVVKAMGTKFLTHERDAWASDLKSFSMSVKTHKQNFIKELLKDNFEDLRDEQLQILFFDIALFLLHFETESGRVCASLSMMHEVSISSITTMMQDLQRYGFLIISEDGMIKVHDVYMEFAKSIQDGDCSLSTRVSSHWKYRVEVADAKSGGCYLLNNHNFGVEGGLRALILELGEGWGRVELHGFSDLKAIGLINCKSTVELRVAGLSKLVILEIRNCAHFDELNCQDTSLLNVKQLCIIKKPTRHVDARPIHVRGLAGLALGWMDVACNVLKRGMACFGWFEEGATLARQMSCLEILRLENAGSNWLRLADSKYSELSELVLIERCCQKTKEIFLTCERKP